MIKICKTCNIGKDINLFHKHKYMSDGRVNHSKTCQQEQHDNWRLNNPIRMKEYRDDWVKKNKEKNKQSKRRYKINNREKY